MKHVTPMPFHSNIINPPLIMKNPIVFIALLAIIGLSFLYIENISHPDSFSEWKKDFAVQFLPGQQSYRRLIFKKNLKQIQTHNSDPTQTYKLGINQFSIYTKDQFASRFLTQVMIPQGTQESNDYEVQLPNSAIDWTTQGKVSRVKNQGQCGSCWAFSATGVAQSYALFYGQAWDLSEQQLVDCTTGYGNHGCQGGYPSYALTWVRDHGLSTEAVYPYVGQQRACARAGGEFRISQVLGVSGCNGLENGILSRPLSVTVDASNWAHYSSGVFGNCAASINHCVLLVGIDPQGVWKIKNSWGTGWGENGFIRLNPGNTCGICAYAGIYVA